MGKINILRVTLGGLVAAIVQFVIEGIANGPLLSGEWELWKTKMATVTTLPAPSTSLAFWFLQSLVLGWIGLWVYAGFRARCGPGPKTAVCCGLTLWAASWLSCLLNYFALGIMPLGINIGNCIAGLIAAPISVLAGAYFYKEG